jgi:hypothetical protein
MKTKIYRVIAGVCLLLTGLIIFACQNSISDNISHDTYNIPIPDGQGRAVLELPVNVSPRAALPNTITITSYRAIFKPPTDASWKPVDAVYNSGETVRVDLGPGEWSGKIYAYGVDTEKHIAQTDVSFEIKAAEVHYIPINLNWNSPASLVGNGTINVKLSFSGQLAMSDLTSATLSLTRLNDSPILSNYQLKEGDNAITVASGVFVGRVVIKDRFDRTGYFTEAIYCFPGETTHWQINVSNEVQEGEYGSSIMVITVNPILPPTLASPVIEAERGVTVVYSLTGSAEQYQSTRWYADGVLQRQANDSMTFYFSTKNRTPGKNEILVIVTDANGMVSSASTRLNIFPEKQGDFFQYSVNFRNTTTLPLEWGAAPDAVIRYQQLNDAGTDLQGISLSQTITDRWQEVWTILDYPYDTVSKIVIDAKCMRNGGYQQYGSSTIQVAYTDKNWTSTSRNGYWSAAVNGGDIFTYNSSDKAWWVIPSSNSWSNTRTVITPYRINYWFAGFEQNLITATQEYIYNSVTTFDYGNQTIHTSVENITIPMNNARYNFPEKLDVSDPTKCLRIVISPYTWWTGSVVTVERIDVKIYP